MGDFWALLHAKTKYGAKEAKVYWFPELYVEGVVKVYYARPNVVDDGPYCAGD